MKKSVFFLTLLLCLSLIFPGAHAEDTYVPGERMRSLVSSALEAGQLVGGEAHFSLTLPDSMLPDDEEGRAQFDALAEVIQGVSLAGGMGRLDDGYRVELGGAYTAPSGDNVYVTGAANLTADGLSLESNLIEGERLSIRWETLLEMLGLSENEIDVLLSLPTTDWDSALNELNDELAQAAETFGKLADPYLVTLADFAATLNIQQRRNVEAENGYPAVENEISITCTAEELSRLLHSLADQVEKDTALRPYLEQLIQNCDLTVTDGDSETTHVMSVSEFCDETRQFADVLAETDGSLGILLGYDDDGLPFYLTLALSDGETLDALAFQMLPGETEDTCVFTLRALESDGDSANTLLDTGADADARPRRQASICRRAERSIRGLYPVFCDGQQRRHHRRQPARLSSVAFHEQRNRRRFRHGADCLHGRRSVRADRRWRRANHVCREHRHLCRYDGFSSRLGEDRKRPEP